MTHHYARSVSTPVLAFIGGAIMWALFGDKIKRRLNESQAWIELKREVREEVMKVKDLTEEKYYKLVDEVSQRYGKLKGISQHELADLIEDLKMHWHRIQDAWKDEAKA